MRAAVAGLVLLTCACGPRRSQTILTKAAELSLVQTQDIRSAYHVGRDRACREEFPPDSHDFSEWRQCMEPSYRLNAAVEAADGSLRAAQHSLDASGTQGATRVANHVIAAAEELTSTMMELGIPVPDEVHKIIQVMRALL